MGFALAAAAFVFLLLGPLREPEEVPATIVVLVGTELALGVEGTASVRSTDSGWYIRFEVSGLPPAPEGSYYEGWVLSDTNAVSIGTFHMRRGDDRVRLWSGVSLVDYPNIAVTLQEEGAGFAPSDQVYLTGIVEDPPD